jgi:23S rRNA (guanosine2251-2'-O)-methyltransferase
MEILYGLHPVEEALRSGTRRFDHVCLARERSDQRLQKIQEACRERGVRVRAESREHLTLLARNPGHQGVVAFVRERSMLDVEDILGPAVENAAPPLLLGLDGVEDPQNLGALLRSAEGAGVSGVLLTERRSAPLSPIAVKTSAGAAEHVRVARVVNLVRAIEQVKAANIWCVGLDERGTMDYTDYDFTTPCMVVLGREGAGLHDLVRRTCDHLLRIPMAGRVASLNVSAAGAVVLYEAYRQRRQASPAQQEAKPSRPPKARKGLGS